MAAEPGSAAESRAASALLDTATRAAAGRWRASHSAHCESDCACEYTRVTAFNAVAFDSKFWPILSLISPQIDSGVWHMRSSVRPTAPSVEFSTGTTA